MKKHFVIYVLLVILFSEDCSACFQRNEMIEKVISTYSTFYEECCCTEPGYTVRNLKWLDPNNSVIGPGINPNIYIDEQDNCIALHIPSASRTLGGIYSCVTQYKDEVYMQKYNLDVYDPLYFYNTTARQYLIYGSDSMIHCEAKGLSSPLFKWTRGQDGQDEINDPLKYQVMPNGVIVRNVTHDDAGIYKCSASVMSTGEELEIDIDVRIMTKPIIKRLAASPENITVEGEYLAIECVAEGWPDPKYGWRKISDLKSGEEKTNATWLQDNNTIRFTTIEAEDAGTYECTAENYVGNSTQIIEITVLVPPSIIGFTNRSAIEGTEIPIFCNATGIPKPNVTIVYEGKTLEDEKSTIYEQYINNYSLLKVDRSTEGFYTCNATNEVDYISEFMYITVLYPPHFGESRTTVWGWNGETVDLICEPDAQPPANITWRYYKNDISTSTEEEINEMLVKEVNSQTNTFHITEDFAPYGFYECKAKNELGEETLRIDLLKGYRPSLYINAWVQEISTTSATFIVDGYNKTLRVGPPVLGYIAEYDTVENYNITNIHNTRTWSVTRPFKLDNLKPNSSYYIRFAPINKVGTGDWGEMIAFDTLEKSAPEPPIWQVDPIQFSRSNVLKWKEPEDNGEPINYYTLRYCPVLEEFDDSQCKEQRIEAATEQQLNDLEQNTTYIFELVAHNAEGNSTPANITLSTIAVATESEPLLSGEVIIGISVIAVVLCLILLDLLLLFWRRQGVIASCCYKKNKKKQNHEQKNSRDKKGLLKDNGENTDDTLRRPNNVHREYEYNKTTGIITGKHSSV